MKNTITITNDCEHQYYLYIPDIGFEKLMESGEIIDLLDFVSLKELKKSKNFKDLKNINSIKIEERIK